MDPAAALVVAGVLGNLERTHHTDKRRMVLDEIEELLPEALANFQLWACKHLAVFRQNGLGNVRRTWIMSITIERRPKQCR